MLVAKAGQETAVVAAAQEAVAAVHAVEAEVPERDAIVIEGTVGTIETREEEIIGAKS